MIKTQTVSLQVYEEKNAQTQSGAQVGLPRMATISIHDF